MTDSHDNPVREHSDLGRPRRLTRSGAWKNSAPISRTPSAALAAKADVPARVQDSANAQLHEAKAFAKENPQILTAVSLGIALVALIIFRRKRVSQKEVIDERGRESNLQTALPGDELCSAVSPAAWCSNRFGSASTTTTRPHRTRKISTVVSEKY